MEYTQVNGFKSFLGLKIIHIWELLDAECKKGRPRMTPENYLTTEEMVFLPLRQVTKEDEEALRETVPESEMLVGDRSNETSTTDLG